MKTKILMVCLGNICRSPLAEGIMRTKLNPDYFWVDSAGTSGWHQGEAPDIRSLEVAQSHGIDLSALRARQFTLDDFDTFDHIFVMDQNNLKDLLALAPNEEAKTKIKLIGASLSHPSIDIPDPYYNDIKAFEQVYHMLNKACEIWSKKIQPK